MELVIKFNEMNALLSDITSITTASLHKYVILHYRCHLCCIRNDYLCIKKLALILHLQSWSMRYPEKQVNRFHHTAKRLSLKAAVGNFYINN